MLLMPASGGRSKRVLIYSHHSFGLGHVSRCRTIANAIVEADPAVSVLIVSGSPIIGSYEFRSGIDFVRIPGVIKQIDTGEYDSANLRVGVEHTLEMRTRIIRDTADIYRPDLFIVDKEPLGLRGQGGPALRLLQDAGARPARRHGRSGEARRRMGAQARRAGAQRPLRRDLDLRPAADQQA